MRANKKMLLCIVMLLAFNANAETNKKNIISTKNSDIILLHKTIISTKKPDIIKLDPKQISCVAETIYSESRGESLTGQISVGLTIMNRSNKIFHEPPCKVVKQQYTQKHIPVKDKEEFHTLAKNVMLGQYRNVIGNMDSFDSFKHIKHPKGSIRIGGHWFYKALKGVA